MSAAGPPQGARPPGGERRAAPIGGDHASSSTGSRQRTANRRTAALLFTIVAVFFVGFVASRFIGDTATGMTVIGLAVLLFLIVAIGRNLRGGR